VLQAVAEIHGYRFEFEAHAIGGVAIKQYGSPLPRTTLDACLASDAVLLGAVGAPEYDRLPPNQRPEAGLLLLRSALGGYANLRPAISYSSIAACSPLRDEIAYGADILIVRKRHHGRSQHDALFGRGDRARRTSRIRSCAQAARESNFS
jgi:3-isopropylmalate dehydrogenase